MWAALHCPPRGLVPTSAGKHIKDLPADRWNPSKTKVTRQYHPCQSPVPRQRSGSLQSPPSSSSPWTPTHGRPLRDVVAACSLVGVLLLLFVPQETAPWWAPGCNALYRKACALPGLSPGFETYWPWQEQASAQSLQNLPIEAGVGALQGSNRVPATGRK